MENFKRLIRPDPASDAPFDKAAIPLPLAGTGLTGSTLFAIFDHLHMAAWMGVSANGAQKSFAILRYDNLTPIQPFDPSGDVAAQARELGRRTFGTVLKPSSRAAAIAHIPQRAAGAASAAMWYWRRFLKETGHPEMPPPEGLMRRLEGLIRGDLTPERYRAWLDSQLPRLEPEPKPDPIADAVNWEILPPGFWVGADPQSWPTPGTADQRRERRERILFLDGLGPQAWYRGRPMERRNYLVAEFPHVAIAECAWEGNALYYVRTDQHDWREVFCLSKAEARTAGAQRILHRADSDWRDQVRGLLENPGLARTRRLLGVVEPGGPLHGQYD